MQQYRPEAKPAGWLQLLDETQQSSQARRALSHPWELSTLLEEGDAPGFLPQRAPWASPRSRLTSWERRRLLRAGLGSGASSLAGVSPGGRGTDSSYGGDSQRRSRNQGGREVLTDSSGLLECAAAAGGDGRRPSQFGELRRCSAHPCSSGKALGEALVGESPGREFPGALRESATRPWCETVARVLAISQSLAPGGVAGCAGLLAKAAVAAARAGLAERGGVGHERGAESSSARALAGPR